MKCMLRSLIVVAPYACFIANVSNRLLYHVSKTYRSVNIVNDVLIDFRNSNLLANVWCYVQVCLVGNFNLAQNLMANLHIARVSSRFLFIF